MKPIQYGKTQAQELSGLQQPIPIREFHGISTFDPLSLSDSYFTDMRNMTSDDFPALVTRPGYTVLGAAGTRVLGMGVWKDKELHVVFNDGTWRRWNGDSWTTLASGLDLTADWSFTNFQGNLDDVNLIGCNGVNAMKRYDGGSVQDLAGAPANGKYITTYQNRLWCAVGIELWSCALDNPTSWNDFDGNANDSYRKTMESSKGEDINMLTGSLSKLTIGMPGSLHELYGGLPADFNTKQITEDLGLANNKSAITQEGFLRMMHKTGIYEYGGGTLPTKAFSDRIGKLLSGITTDSVAGSDGTKLYFNLPPDRLMVYDPRSGVDAWSLWRDISATQIVTMGNQLYIGDAQGRLLRLEGTTDGGNGISWSATTKPFNSGILAQRQRWYKLWVMVELSGSMQVHLSPSISGEDWTLVQDIPDSTQPLIRRVIIPVSSFTRENWIRVRFSGVGWARLHEFTRQGRQLPIS